MTTFFFWGLALLLGILLLGAIAAAVLELVILILALGVLLFVCYLAQAYL